MTPPPTNGSGTTGLQIRPYRPGDEEAINRGFNEAFNTSRSLDEWRWKFAPVGERSSILLAVDGEDALVAHFSGIRDQMQVDGRLFPVAQVVDLYRLPRPGMEERGVFTRTGQAFFDQYCSPDAICMVYGFPGTRSLDLGRRRLGYGTPHPLPYLVRPASRFRLGWPRYRVGWGPLPPDLDRLWERAGRRYPVCVVRSQARARRRFLPSVRHLTVRKQDTLKAWAAVLPGSPLRVLDLVWDGADPRALHTLDRALCRRARAAGAGELAMWLSGDPEATGHLVRCGWSAIPHPLHLHLSAITWHPELPPGSDLVPRMYVTWADSDLV